MTGGMSERIIFLPNSKTMVMNLMQSRLNNIVKSNVMKKLKESDSKNI